MAHTRSAVPRIIGTVGVKAPGMVIRLGFSYLRMKKKSQRATKRFVQSLEESGIPKEHARKLGESYSSDISIRKLMGGRAPALLENLRF